MKRIILFLATNLAVMLVLSLVLNILGIGRGVSAAGDQRRRTAGVLRWWSASPVRSSPC